MQFVSNHSVQKETIKERKKPVIVRAFPSPPANPKGPQFGLFCKYQLLKYKPWKSWTRDAWDGLDEVEDNNDMFCQKWNEFLQSELGHTLVPNWNREFHNAELYFERAENEDDFEENFEGEREEWMHLADLCANNDTELNDENNNDNVQYWQGFRANYSEEQIGGMVS